MAGASDEMAPGEYICVYAADEVIRGDHIGLVLKKSASIEGAFERVGRGIARL